MLGVSSLKQNQTWLTNKALEEQKIQYLCPGQNCLVKKTLNGSVSHCVSICEFYDMVQTPDSGQDKKQNYPTVPIIK